MSGTGKKILGTLFFIVLLMIMFYLAAVPKEVFKRNITRIEIFDNRLLPAVDYLKQTKLLNLNNYNDIPLSVIKDRLEKHPYVYRADVELKGNQIAAFLIEKKMAAVVLKGTSPFFISEHFEIIPFIPNTKFVDLPVISNPQSSDVLKPNSYVKNKDLFDALRIIETIRQVDDKMLTRLSEINLRSGGDILLSFSGYSAPVIFGRKDEARKIVYLESLWKNQMMNDLSNNNYIDLRFADNIYFCPISADQSAGSVQ